ncbi:alpha/beta hydrolase family protein [Embleya hyalina]|uniref:Serine hydrolase n=1 Tax=Embleya hyalina TaxID=516124 RepID=A0A401YGK8_9ACTN|nr:S9 family peptidase [Embleya hyalina]GCD93698.1 serine hydrolase [Embleya hyalina]
MTSDHTAAHDPASEPIVPDRFAVAEEYFRSLYEPAFGAVSRAEDPHVRPDGGAVAFTGTVFTELVGTGTTRVCLAEAGEVRILTEGAGNQRAARFSPDGTRLAHLSDAHREGDFQPEISDPADGTRLGWARVPGIVEYLSWSPDGGRLLLGVAGYGADLAGGQGSGTVAKAADRAPDWAPEVQANSPEEGGRSLWIAEPAAAPGEWSVRRVSAPGTNVWSACWAGPDALAGVASGTPGEESWYVADLRLIAAADGSERVLHTGDRQFGPSAASPSGRTVAVIEAICSDRQVEAGDILLVSTRPDADGAVSRVDTGGVDVTSIGWIDEDRLGWVGLRGLDTVVGEYRRDTGKSVELWCGEETFGGRYPELSFSAHGHAGVRHGYLRFPELVLLERDFIRTVADLSHPGAARLVARAGTAEAVTWTAPDGLEIQGILCRPAGPGPYPLVVNVHGGPVWAFRNSWSMGLAYTPLLVARGYAVLHPNPRGSSGRGQPFAEAVFGDMGGADTHDFRSGIDALVARGIADPDRIGVMGGSYGGFMSAWLITQDPDRFAAAAPTAPVTDWISQHHTSNIPFFDRLFLADEPLAYTGRYVDRSPLRFAARVRTPTLITAGELDRCTPPGQAREFHRALIEAGVRATLVVYPKEGHGVRAFPALIDHCARVLGWFDAYMAPDPRD